MYLGLDLGAFRTEGAVARRRPRRGCRCHRTAGQRPPVPGLVEQDPADWIAACAQVLDDLSDHVGSVQAIGIAGHMHGVVLLDAAGEVGAPLPALERHPGRYRSCGHGRRPGLPRHLRHHRVPRLFCTEDGLGPGSRARALGTDRTGLFPKDFLAYWLTGTLNCEPSDAAGSALFDPGKGDWSPALCTAAGLSPDLLPPILDSDSPRGPVRPEIAERFGLNPACARAGGATAAASLGIGAVGDGEGQVSLGTRRAAHRQ